MGMSYQIFPDKRLIVETFSGPVKLEEMLGMFEELWKEPLYDRTYSILMDFSEAHMDMGVEEIKKLTGYVLAADSSSRGRVAIVVSGPLETAFTMLISRQMKEHQPVSVFSTVETAKEHLESFQR